MKTSYLKLVACGGGIGGLALMYWLETTAIDGKGLMVPLHPAWISLWALTVIMLAMFWVCTRSVQGPAAYESAFPGSLTAAIGCVPAMILPLQTATASFQNGQFPTAILPALTALAFLLAALCRLTGKRTPFLCHVILCVWLALEMLNLYRAWSFEPRLHLYCFQLFATAALTMTACQFAAFGADKGNHKALWFWSLTAGFLCLLSINHGLFYAAGAAWVLTNLSTLSRRKYLKKA